MYLHSERSGGIVVTNELTTKQSIYFNTM